MVSKPYAPIQCRHGKNKYFSVDNIRVAFHESINLLGRHAVSAVLSPSKHGESFHSKFSLMVEVDSLTRRLHHRIINSVECTLP
jgi:hypothetical protein